MKKPKAMNLFLDSLAQLKVLSDSQAGRLIKALLIYANSGEKPNLEDDQTVEVMFIMMSNQVDRDFAKYEEACKKRTRAAKVAAAARYNNPAILCDSHTNACDCCQDEDEDKNEKEDEDKYEYKNEDDNKKEPLSDEAAVGRASPTRDIDTDINEIVEYLNKRVNTRYRSNAVQTRRLIGQKLSENYTVADLKKVIDKKRSEWLGTDYEKYLRPDTLFGKHFESYLNTPENPRRLPKSKLHPWQNDSQDDYLRLMQSYEEKCSSMFDD